METNFHWTFLKYLSAGLACLLVTEPAYAWGPGMHFYLADQLLKMGMVGGAASTLINRRDRWFYYGNVVADVVIGKGFIDYEQHSHNWNLAFSLRDQADDEREEAFALGVWTHLAADTVAHNDFVPERIRRDNFPEKLGHAYWEFRAERWIPDEYWLELEELISYDFEGYESLLEDTIEETVMPFPVNWAVIKSHLKLSTWNTWRRLTDFYTRISRHDLTDEEMEPYVELCLERMTASLSEDEARERVLAMDPTGDFPEHHSQPGGD
jgi:hypothetical protein